MAAVMAFSGMNITANAAASSSVLPSGGIELTLAKGNKLESLSACRKQERPVLRSIRPEYRPGHRDEGVLPGPLGAA